MGEWKASGRAILSNTGWRCTVFWHEPGIGVRNPGVVDRRKTRDIAERDARAEADRRNLLGISPE